MAYRGFESKVIFGNDRPIDKEACQDCDDCIAVCPTGALRKPVKAGEERAKKATVYQRLIVFNQGGS